MAKSLIYTRNNVNQALIAGSTIDVGSVIRRFGQNITLNGNAINLSGAGYYKVSANVEVTGTAAGDVTIELLKDGILYDSRDITIAEDAVAVIPFDTVIRLYGCCTDNSTNLTFVLNGAAETISGISVVITKE